MFKYLSSLWVDFNLFPSAAEFYPCAFGVKSYLDTARNGYLITVSNVGIMNDLFQMKTFCHYTVVMVSIFGVCVSSVCVGG